MAELKSKMLKRAAPLFRGWDDTMIWSCLEGCMGRVFADNAETPQSAQAALADFCFYAGRPNIELARNCPPSLDPDFFIAVPQNEEWAKLLEQTFGTKAKRVTRYALKKEPEIFKAEKLRAIIRNADPKFEIRLFDEAAYRASARNGWSKDFCSQFPDYGFYRLHGLGAGAFYNGELVSGASSYTFYSKGIEIEIDTRRDFRRRGLALACGARLILECLQRRLYPSWDAQNEGSLDLAEKLGYHFEKEYPAYEITGCGNGKGECRL